MAKRKKKNTWETHPGNEMVLQFVREFVMDLGTVMEMKHRSRKDKFFRKKYMGVCSPWSLVMRVMMRRFPRRAAR